MADNYTFKDAAGNTVTHASKDVGSGVHATRHVMVDAANVEVFFKGTSILATAVSVTTTATALPSSALTNRRAIVIYNNGAGVIYLGAVGVTAAAGYPLQPGQSVGLETGSLVVYGIVASGTSEARVMEIA